MIELKVGMATEDGSIRILDEDRLCYKVLSRSKNAEGVRTISKELLAEWVPCVEKNPTKNSFEVRDMLSGKSDIDKFEYGYAATLKKMSEMVLGRLNVVFPESNFSEEFVNWFAEHRGKGKKNTAEKYLGYFRTLTDPYQEPTNSYWHGLYKVVYGKDAKKKVVSIGTLAEFVQVYGDLIAALEKKVKGRGMDDAGFQKAIDWFWKPEVKPHTCVTSALNAYRDFLGWREKRTESKPVNESSNVDRLVIALRYFKVHRGEYVDGEKVNEKIREYFDPLTEADLLAFDDAKFTELFVSSSEDGHMWASHHYVWEKIKKSGCKVSMKFVAKLKSEPFTAEQFCGKNFKEEHSVPDGFGPSVISELQMKFHPREYCIFTKRTARAFEILGFGNVIPSTALTAERYAKVYEITEVIRSKMESMGIGLMRSDDSTPDYLSANEFVDFVCHYEEELAKEFANGDFEPPKEINRLAVAVKLFAAAREAPKGGPNGWASYDAWAKAARETFAEVDAGMLAAADFDYAEFARKFVYNPTVANAYFKDHDANEKAEVGKFISQNRQSPKAASWYLDKGNLPKVKGLGVGCALNFMMKVRPAEFATYSPMIDKALMSVGLLAKPLQDDPTIESYEQNKALQGQVLAKMHELHIGKAADDESAADYLTVNEFAWWLSDEKNQNLIKEKIMEQKMKKPNIAIKAGSKTLGALIGQNPDSMMSRLTAALLTKPFAILAGASGTGKSRMVRQLAYMTCLNTDLQEEAKDATAPGNYRLVQVKPNWHDSSDLLGYRSAINEGTYVTTDFVKFVLKAHAYPDTPFFVCLDEMNLAPVEQYFAEFLSASEDVKKADDGKTLVSAALIKPSDFGGDVLNLEPEYELAADRKVLIEKIGLFIPHNLYVVGTVNMDDTTCQFSRKVLDRAMTIEMNEVKLETLQKKDVMTFDDLLLTEPEINLFTERAEFDGTKLDNPFRDKLDSLRGDLESSPFAIAYRFAREAVMYREAIAKIGNDTAKAAKDEIALDHMSLMKILPRITGTTTERKGVTDKLTAFFSGLGRPLSLKKLNEMIAAASGNGEYLSFWP